MPSKDTREGTNLQLWIPGRNVISKLSPDSIRNAIARYFAKASVEDLVQMIETENMFNVTQTEVTGQHNVFKATLNDGKTVDLCIVKTPSEISATKLNGDSILFSVFSTKEKMFVNGKEKEVNRLFPFEKPNILSVGEDNRAAKQMREKIDQNNEWILDFFNKHSKEIKATPDEVNKLVEIVSEKWLI